MKEIRILALATALASMLAIGASVSAQMQDQTTDDTSSTTTTTVIEQQTVTTPADPQAPPPAAMGGSSTGLVNVYGSTFSVVPLTDQKANQDSISTGTGTDYNESPYWRPEDWNYVTEEGGVGGQ